MPAFANMNVVYCRGLPAKLKKPSLTILNYWIIFCVLYAANSSNRLIVISFQQKKLQGRRIIYPATRWFTAMYENSIFYFNLSLKKAIVRSQAKVAAS